MRVYYKGKMGHGGIYVGLRGEGNQVLELNWYPKGNRFNTKYTSGAELDHLAFRAKNVRKEFNRLVKSGAKVAIRPFLEGKSSEYAFVKDPDGIWIELWGYRSRK